MTQSDLKFGKVIDVAGTKAYLLECNGETGVGFYEKNRCKKKAAMRYLISEGWLPVPKYGWTINNVQIGEE
jgi:hypothetical protein